MESPRRHSENSRGGCVRRGEHTFPSIVLALFEGPAAWFSGHSQQMIDLGAALRAELEALLGDDGVLLYPSHPRTAPRHNWPLVQRAPWAYTALWNVLECAVTQVPMGLDRRGLPTGIQVIAPKGGDHLTLAVAKALEKGPAGWVPTRHE